MGEPNRYRFGAHAVVVAAEDPTRFLMLRPAYLPERWALPGGHVDTGEDALAAVVREVHEELGLEVPIGPLTGLYHQPEFHAQLALFRAELSTQADIHLSDEHTDHRWMTLDDLRAVMQSTNGDQAIAHALDWNGEVEFGTF